MNIFNIGNEEMFLIVSISFIFVIIAISILFGIKAEKFITFCRDYFRGEILPRHLVHFAGVRFLKIISKAEPKVMFFSQRDKASIMLIKREQYSKWFNSILSEAERCSIDWLREKGFVEFNKKTNFRFEIILTKKGRRKLKLEIFKEKMFGEKTSEEFGVIYVHPFGVINKICIKENLFSSKVKIAQFLLI